MDYINRRNFIKSSAAIGTVSIAGCLDPGETVNEMDRPIIGDEDAEFELHVFEDYSCPACQDFVLNHKSQIEDNYIDTGVAQLHHYDYPIPVNRRWSTELANVSRAVKDLEDSETFFEFTNILYENQGDMSVSIIRDAAENVGVSDIDYVVESGSASRYQPVIDDDYDEGQAREIGGTPTVYILGGPFEEPEALPAYTADVVSNVLDSNM